MPVALLMPALSPTMTEGNIAKWIKKVGDEIVSGDIIAEVETDKATMEVEAVDEGKLASIIFPDGAENVQVNILIGVIAVEGDTEKDIENFIRKNTDIVEENEIIQLLKQKKLNQIIMKLKKMILIFKLNKKILIIKKIIRFHLVILI